MYLYVLDSFTNDVTVVNTTKHEVENIIPVGGGAKGLKLLSNNRHLAVLADKEKLRLIDTSTNDLVEERDYSGNFIIIPNSSMAVALSKKKSAVYFLDASTLSVTSVAEGIKNPVELVIH